ncbi:MAG: plastocyanin/azurin family copper-binding protein [Vicingaceae bacterium]
MKVIKSTLMIALSLGLFACGGTESKKSTSSNEKAAKEKTKKTEAKQVEKKTADKEVVEITLIAKGEAMTEIAFEPKSLTIPANSRVKLTLKNESKAAGMLHNFVLVELGTGQEIATAGISAGEKNQFVPDDDRVLAYTEVSKMGESVTVEFDAPAKGSYHYICTYPGHYPNMIGRLNVE